MVKGNKKELILAALLTLISLSGCKNKQPQEPNWSDSVIKACELREAGHYNDPVALKLDMYLELQRQQFAR